MSEAAALQPQLLAAAEHAQRQASDPTVSAWVRANAGTGKTHVLVQRILRLLLSGAAPRSILCLTFTKNAAAEMEARVLTRLGEWATASADELAAKLSITLARPPVAAELVLARSLFATVVDGASGLAIMTIHGFCERVLRRYGLEAGVAPGFSVLTEEESKELLAKASTAAFSHAGAGPVRAALDTAVRYANERDFGRVLQAMLATRAAFVHLLKVSGSDGAGDAVGRLRRVFGIGPGESAEEIAACVSECLPPEAISRAIALLEGDARRRLQAVAAAASRDDKLAALKAVFATSRGEPRKSVLGAAVAKREPDLNRCFVRAQAEFLAGQEALRALEVCEATAALYTLAEAIFAHYAALKSERGGLDFDDLIEMTLGLLSRSAAAQWVLYQLDGRIDHILIDEAQDTSPGQWAIVERLTSEFFAGEGAREMTPTLFAVGDEKQSIYGFQGAVPELLAEYGATYEERARAAAMVWRSVDLGVSFRSLGPILDGVDRVCKQLPGFDAESLVSHTAYRAEPGGFIELWEPERGERQDKGTVWEADDEEEAPTRPAETLAERIAAKIGGWLASNEALPSTGRPVEPGDIIVLLRKREPMAGLIEKALKRRGIAVAGADRVALLDEIAVKDLLALADALLQPQDDLALACVLKGPLMGLSEDELFALAHPREGSLWEALEAAAQSREGVFARAWAKLARWREPALLFSAFDFFASILEGEQGREAFTARLGLQCIDAIDEFLNLAESFSANGGGVAEFAAFLRRSASEVKRETEQAASEVRIMTVHGAKGLEANVVILADCCSVRGDVATPVYVVDCPATAVPMPVWAVKGSGSLPPIRAAKEKLKRAEEREHGRLLYVAMTRARDRLHIAGFHTGAMPDGCWYRLVERALAPALREVAGADGELLRRAGDGSPPEVFAPAVRRVPIEKPTFVALPSPTPEFAVPILAPSQLTGGDDTSRPGRGAGIRSREAARAAGTLAHRLLELLPQLPSSLRDRAARVIAEASGLSAPDRQAAVASALALLRAPVFTAAAARSFMEAELGLVLTDEAGAPYAIMLGKADRIDLEQEQVRVLDYKSSVGAGPQGEVADGYLRQLACYATALRRIHGVAVGAALVDVSARVVLPVDEERLRAALAEVRALAGE